MVPRNRLKFCPGLLLLALCVGNCARDDNGLKDVDNPATVIFISIDCLRADHLGCYGYRFNTSPHIDRLAQDAVVFENAISQASWTLPSYFSQFVSQYLPPIWSGPGDRRLPPTLTQMPEYFKAAGYATAGFIDTVYLQDKFGFGPGFDVYDQEARDGTEPLLARAWRWLRDEPNPRRFLFFHTLDVHGAYRPPAPFDTLFVTPETLIEPGENEGVPVADKKPVFNMIPRYQYLEGHRNLDYYACQYDGCIRWVDDLVGAFMDSMRSADLYEESLIVVSADHGESLTEHQFYLDHGVLYDDVIRVPLLVKLPHNRAAGLRIPGQVQLIDLLPTFLDVLEIEPSQPLAGSSLLPVIAGDVEETAPYAFFMEGIMPQWGVRTNEWKFIRKQPGGQQNVWETCPDSDPDNRELLVDELFDLRQDPGETRNVIGAEPGIADSLRTILMGWLTEQREMKDHIAAGAPVVMDERTRQELRALGYAGD